MATLSPEAMSFQGVVRPFLLRRIATFRLSQSTTIKKCLRSFPVSDPRTVTMLLEMRAIQISRRTWRWMSPPGLCIGKTNVVELQYYIVKKPDPPASRADSKPPDAMNAVPGSLNLLLASNETRFRADMSVSLALRTYAFAMKLCIIFSRLGHGRKAGTNRPAKVADRNIFHTRLNIEQRCK